MNKNERIDYIKNRLQEIEKEKQKLEKELSELISPVSDIDVKEKLTSSVTPETPEKKVVIHRYVGMNGKMEFAANLM